MYREATDGSRIVKESCERFASLQDCNDADQPLSKVCIGCISIELRIQFLICHHHSQASVRTFDTISRAACGRLQRMALWITRSTPDARSILHGHVHQPSTTPAQRDRARRPLRRTAWLDRADVQRTPLGDHPPVRGAPATAAGTRSTPHRRIPSSTRGAWCD